MSRYSIKNPSCAKCGVSLVGEIAAMIRPIEFWAEGSATGYYRYKFNSKKTIWCLGCFIDQVKMEEPDDSQ